MEAIVGCSQEQHEIVPREMTRLFVHEGLRIYEAKTFTITKKYNFFLDSEALHFLPMVKLFGFIESSATGSFFPKNGSGRTNR